MGIIIDLPENSVKPVKEAITLTARELVSRINNLVSEWQSLQPVLEQLGIQVANPAFPVSFQRTLDSDMEIDLFLSTYDVKWSWLKKIKFLIAKRGFPMTTKEIMEAIAEREPNMTIEKLNNSIPATLSVAAKEGKISRVLNTLKNEYEYHG